MPSTGNSTYDYHNSQYETKYDPKPAPPKRWSWKRRILTIAIPILLFIIILILAIGIAVSRSHKFTYTPPPSDAQVTNTTAFQNGGAATNANDTTDDGIGSGTDAYTYYSGPASSFPQKNEWLSFANMWMANKDTLLTSCKTSNWGQDNSPDDVMYIYEAIQSCAAASLVDHRLILAVILQESRGCVHVPTSNNGVRNPGLMQSANGAAYSSYHRRLSILQMVQDGTQGTVHGDGLVQNLNAYGNAYGAARGYNSGSVAADGNLSNGNGATGCYVSDVANRLTGWVKAESKCTED